MAQLWRLSLLLLRLSSVSADEAWWEAEAVTAEAWFRADSLSCSDGASISSWSDSTTNGNDATATTDIFSVSIDAPTCVASTSALNDQPSVRFGSGAYTSMILGTGIFPSTGLTVFALVNELGDLNDDYPFLFDQGALAGYGYGVQLSTNRVGLYTPGNAGGVNDEVYDGNFTTDTGPHLVLVQVTFDGANGNQKLSIDGGEVISSTISLAGLLSTDIDWYAAGQGGSSAGGPFTIGGIAKSTSASGTRYGSFDLFELAVFDAVFDDADIQSAYAYFESHYDLNLTTTLNVTTTVASSCTINWYLGSLPDRSCTTVCEDEGLSCDESSMGNITSAYELDYIDANWDLGCCGCSSYMESTEHTITPYMDNSQICYYSTSTAASSCAASSADFRICACSTCDTTDNGATTDDKTTTVSSCDANYCTEACAKFATVPGFSTVTSAAVNSHGRCLAWCANTCA